MKKININIFYLNGNTTINRYNLPSKITIEENSTYSELLKKMNLNEFTVLLLDSNNNPIILNEKIKETNLKLFKITFD